MSFADWDWDELREVQARELIERMRFTLYFDGELPSSAQKGRLEEKQKIREKLHWQLLQLFRDHVSLPKPKNSDWANWPKWKWPQLALEGEYDSPGGGWREEETVVSIGDLHFLPLVRSALDLICELDVLFLRVGTPGLMERGTRYDIDNRLLTLFDALTVPTGKQQAYAIAHNTLDPNSPIFCLLGDDDRITAINVRTDSLLVPSTKENLNWVRLIIGVTLRATRSGWHNNGLRE